MRRTEPIAAAQPEEKPIRELSVLSRPKAIRQQELRQCNSGVGKVKGGFAARQKALIQNVRHAASTPGFIVGQLGNGHIPRRFDPRERTVGRDQQIAAVLPVPDERIDIIIRVHGKEQVPRKCNTGDPAKRFDGLSRQAHQETAFIFSVSFHVIPQSENTASYG